MTSVTMSPGTMSNDATVGTIAWSNPDNAKLSDEVYVALDSGVAAGNYLKATNFGFSIPTGATINGILVEIKKYGYKSNALSHLTDNVIEIVKSDGTIGSTNRADTTTEWPATDPGTYFSYGSSSDLWGETWDSAKINSANFGVVLQVLRDYWAGNIYAYVDHIQVTVYYTASATVVGPFPTFLRV